MNKSLLFFVLAVSLKRSIWILNAKESNRSKATRLVYACLNNLTIAFKPMALWFSYIVQSVSKQKPNDTNYYDLKTEHSHRSERRFGENSIKIKCCLRTEFEFIWFRYWTVNRPRVVALRSFVSFAIKRKKNKTAFVCFTPRLYFPAWKPWTLRFATKRKKITQATFYELDFQPKIASSFLIILSASECNKAKA